jgi:hypothetical protein
VLAQEERVTTKPLFGILAVAMLTTACGGGEVPAPNAEPTAEAAPATPATEPAPAAAPAPAATPAPEPTPAPAPAPRRPAASAPARPAAPAAAATPAAAPAPAKPAVPEYREYTVPAGTLLSLELQTSLASDVNQVEDAVRATLRQPITVDGATVVPAGADVSGIVTAAERAGRVKGRSRVAFQFNSLRHDGERHRLETDPIEQMGEATKGEDATKVGVGAGAGAIIGGILGGKSGAAKGAAIGAGAGAGTVLATRGREVRIEAGTPVEARLASPLTIQVRVR